MHIRCSLRPSIRNHQSQFINQQSSIRNHQSAKPLLAPHDVSAKNRRSKFKQTLEQHDNSLLMKYLFIILTLTFVSCNWAKRKTKETVNKTGEVVAKAGSEFADGVSKGVEKTFKNQVVISDQLKTKGIQTGKIIIHGTDSTTDNILTTYFMFDNDFDQNIVVKVISEEGQEYGRTTQNLKGQKGEAKYIDFVFDKRTNIDSKGKLLFE